MSYKLSIFISLISFFLATSIAKACDTTTRLVLSSSGYSGEIYVQLRNGNRPGSKVIAQDLIITSGQKDFYGVCPGRYFFSFATKDSPQVSVTSYFDVEADLELAEMTVYLSRTKSGVGNKVQTINKKDL